MEVKIKDTNGRMELVKKFTNEILVFVDYAHTPDALLKTLKSLKENYSKECISFSTLIPSASAL